MITFKNLGKRQHFESIHPNALIIIRYCILQKKKKNDVKTLGTFLFCNTTNVKIHTFDGILEGANSQ